MLNHCVLLEATLYEGVGGGGEGGGRYGERAVVVIEQGTTMKTLRIFRVYHKLLTMIVGSSCVAALLCLALRSLFGLFGLLFC